MKRPLPPRTVLRLLRLWPHARKQGCEIGQIWRVGYYSRQDGDDTVWLVDQNGKYSWTANHDFISRHFEIVEISNEKSLYGAARETIGPLDA